MRFRFVGYCVGFKREGMEALVLLGEEGCLCAGGRTCIYGIYGDMFVWGVYVRWVYMVYVCKVVYIFCGGGC